MNRIDPREPRLTAAAATVVLAVAAITVTTPTAVALLAVQTLVFALGTFGGLRVQPYGVIARRVLLPRLAARTAVPAAPYRFAQGVGLVLTALALVLVLAGQTTTALLFTALALAGTFLSAAFNYCIGCDLYLSLRRATPSG